MIAKGRISILQQLGGIFLLGAYVFVSLFANISHEFTHEHISSEVLHTEEAELDECHRTLYHAEQNNGCDHREHFLPHEHSCELCDAFVRNFQWDGFQLTVNTNKALIEKEDVYSCILSFNRDATHSPSRAPPYMV